MTYFYFYCFPLCPFNAPLAMQINFTDSAMRNAHAWNCAHCLARINFYGGGGAACHNRPLFCFKYNVGPINNVKKITINKDETKS